MSDKVLSQVNDAIKRKNKIFVRQKSDGSARIKIKHGLFNAFTKRYEADFDTYVKVKSLLREAQDRIHLRNNN